MGFRKKNNDTASNQNVAVVSGDVRSGFPRWAIFLAAGILVVVLVALGLFFYRKQHVQKAPAGLVPAQQSQYLSDRGDYDAAEAVWQKQFDEAKDTPTKLGIYYQQVQVAIKFKRYDDAKDYAASAMKLDSKSYLPYAAYADIAIAQGDHADAKKYLQQTIDHIDPNLDGANLIKRDYQTKLDSLQ